MFFFLREIKQYRTAILLNSISGTNRRAKLKVLIVYYFKLIKLYLFRASLGRILSARYSK